MYKVGGGGGALEICLTRRGLQKNQGPAVCLHQLGGENKPQINAEAQGQRLLLWEKKKRGQVNDSRAPTSFFFHV